MKDSVLEQIGPRLRAARIKQDRTLEDLATRTGMSVSTLSRLESGKRQASLEILLPLTRELRISIEHVIPAEGAAPRIRPTQSSHNGVQIVRLFPPGVRPRPFKMTYPARKT